MQIVRPFELINQATDYDVKSVTGGGHTTSWSVSARDSKSIT